MKLCHNTRVPRLSRGTQGFVFSFLAGFLSAVPRSHGFNSMFYAVIAQLAIVIMLHAYQLVIPVHQLYHPAFVPVAVAFFHGRYFIYFLVYRNAVAVEADSAHDIHLTFFVHREVVVAFLNLAHVIVSV